MQYKLVNTRKPWQCTCCRESCPKGSQCHTDHNWLREGQLTRVCLRCHDSCSNYYSGCWRAVAA